MPQEKYRLDVLLRLKERQKKEAEQALSVAIQELKQEEEKLQQLESLKQSVIEKREKYRKEMRDKVSTGQSQVRQSEYYMNYMKKLSEDEELIQLDIENQKQVINNAEEKLKRAKRDYIDASTELNMMEKHKDVWQKKKQKEKIKIENKKMNEMGNIVHQIKKNQ